MNWLDSLIAFWSPGAAARRLQARATLQQVQNLLGDASSPYQAAKLSRLNPQPRKIVKENDIARSTLDYLRSESWNLYRNNPTARKIVRSLEAKVIGKGMQPESLAMLPDGSPAVAFRARVKQLWQSLQSGFDARGVPGRGGLTMTQLQKLALRSMILSGDVFYRLRTLNAEKKKQHGLPVSVGLQLIDSCRLADESEVANNPQLPAGHTLFRGVELNSEGERVAYWFRNQAVDQSANTPANVVRLTVQEVGHLMQEEDIDQLRGVPWFAAALIGMRDTADLQGNVLKASALAACFVGSYSKPTGATRFGLNQSAEASATSADGTDLTDADGNTITKLQPAMLINTGKDGKFELHSPNQPAMNPEGFVTHLQRQTATGVPGIKSSTVTGDYRKSSFSSERAADNDIWPELHDLQDHFTANFCQPVFETVLRKAVLDGYFEGIVTEAEFQAEPSNWSACKWQGPVALSINPTDDVKAASDRIKAGVSSLQMECAKVNVNWRDVLNDMAELYAVVAEKELPEEVANNIVGVDASDVVEEEPAAVPGDDSEDTTEDNTEEVADAQAA